MTTRNNWTRDEHILAFNLYCQIPFGTIHIHNPKIKDLSKLLGRSVGAVSRKLANFSRLDPYLKERGIRGLEHGAKGEEQIWNKFAENPEMLAFESQHLLAERIGKTVEEIDDIETDDLPVDGIEREAIVRVRVNQCFFRRRILSAFNFRCCVTGLSIQSLLVASHIIPWAEDAKNRLNPQNGLCLNAIHDRAFDRGLMWIDPGFIIRLSPIISDLDKNARETVGWLKSFDGKKLLLSRMFQPDPMLLAKHADRCRSKGLHPYPN